MLGVVGTRYNGHFPASQAKTREIYDYFTLIEKNILGGVSGGFGLWLVARRAVLGGGGGGGLALLFDV